MNCGDIEENPGVLDQCYNASPLFHGRPEFNSSATLVK